MTNPSQAPLAQLGALSSLGEKMDQEDARLLLAMFGKMDEWTEQEPRLLGATSKLHAYSFGAVWSDKRVGTKVGWRLGFSAIPWSAAARSLLDVSDGRIIVRPSGSTYQLTLEHVVPKGIIFKKLRELSVNGTSIETCWETVEYLREYTRLAVVTKDEGQGRVVAPTTPTDLKQRETMRRYELPSDDYLARVTDAGLPWQWARYVEVGLDLTTFTTLADASDLDPEVSAALPR